MFSNLKGQTKNLNELINLLPAHICESQLLFWYSLIRVQYLLSKILMFAYFKVSDPLSPHAVAPHPLKRIVLIKNLINKYEIYLPNIKAVWLGVGYLFASHLGLGKHAIWIASLSWTESFNFKTATSFKVNCSSNNSCFIKKFSYWNHNFDK